MKLLILTMCVVVLGGVGCSLPAEKVGNVNELCPENYTCGWVSSTPPHTADYIQRTDVVVGNVTITDGSDFVRISSDDDRFFNTILLNKKETVRLILDLQGIMNTDRFKNLPE